jgi:hypothetical protein
MKRKVATALLAAAVLSMALPAAAHREHRSGTYSHPLRFIAHLGHAVGIGLEFVFVRPMHWIASQGELDIVFGHRSYLADDSTYFEWTQSDYRPSIADVRTEQAQQGRRLAN